MKVPVGRYIFVFWIRIGSGFSQAVDPDPDWAKMQDPDSMKQDLCFFTQVMLFCSVLDPDTDSVR